MKLWKLRLELAWSRVPVFVSVSRDSGIREAVVMAASLHDPVAIYLAPRTFAALCEEHGEYAKWVRIGKLTGAQCDGIEFPYDLDKKVFVHSKHRFYLDLRALPPSPTFDVAAR